MRWCAQSSSTSIHLPNFPCLMCCLTRFSPQPVLRHLQSLGCYLYCVSPRYDDRHHSSAGLGRHRPPMHSHNRSVSSLHSIVRVSLRVLTNHPYNRAGIFFIFTFSLYYTHCRLTMLNQTTVESLAFRDMREKEQMTDGCLFWDRYVHLHFHRCLRARTD